MKVCMVGTGYVGLVTGTLFADRGNRVVCVDQNPDIVESLNNGILHIFEPGLEGLVAKNVERGNLVFTTKIEEAIPLSEVIFLAVGTPSTGDGSFNLEFLKAAARSVGRCFRESSGFKVVAVKSTVPQGTHQMLADVIDGELDEQGKEQWAYVSNPEFLAEGNAVSDFSKPARILIGTDSDRAFEIMEELYHPFNIRRDRMKRGSPADTELTKLFSNTMLALKVATVNEFARIADVVPGSDMDIIRKMMCEDPRIGHAFMFPSPGYGGSCFPKDVQGLVHQAKLDGYSPLLLKHIHSSNEEHKSYVGERITALLKDTRQPVIAVWGVTFKPNSDDMRDAASIPIVTRLLNEGARVVAYDPRDEKAREIFGDSVHFAKSQYEAVEGADALMLLTEWHQFDAPDYQELRERMRGRLLFDLRNRWMPGTANRHGFHYAGLGRNYPLGEDG